MKKNYIVFCVEKGPLEEQAILLAKSYQRYLSNDFECIAVSPRLDNYLSDATEQILREFGVEVLKTNLNINFQYYPIANKVLVMKLMEQQLDFEQLIFTDTDTVFLNKIDQELMNSHASILLRPVDNKGPGSLGLDDGNDLFWQKVFSMFDLNCPEPTILTTVRKERIRNYFNAGFIWSCKQEGFFKQWYKDFIELVNSGLRPFGYLSREGDDYRCLDQVALAVTATRYSKQLKLLPRTYNYPIPFKPIIDKENIIFDRLVHIHYHKWFQHSGFLDHVVIEKEKNSEQYQWLKNKLPLMPEIFGSYKC